jgi:hypothetical protein
VPVAATSTTSRTPETPSIVARSPGALLTVRFGRDTVNGAYVPSRTKILDFSGAAPTACDRVRHGSDGLPSASSEPRVDTQ